MSIVVLNHGILEKEFLDLGYTVLRGSESLSDSRLPQALLAVSCFRPLARNPFAAIQLARSLKKAGVPHIVWNCEGPSHFGEKRWRLLLLRLFKIMDAYAGHSLQNCRGFATDVIYLPNAAGRGYCCDDPLRIKQLRNSADYKFDVSFFGNIHSPEMRPRLAFLTELTQRLDKLRISHSIRKDKFPLAEQIELIQSSRINLSVHAGTDIRYNSRQRYRPRSWGMSERCYGVPAAGGFLLSDERFHASDDFIPGVEWASFTDIEDCVNRIRYYLDHFQEARSIAEAANRRVLAQHTYLHRAKHLIAFATHWHATKK